MPCERWRTSGPGGSLSGAWEDQWSRQREPSACSPCAKPLARGRERTGRAGQRGGCGAFPADEHGGVEALEGPSETARALADAQAQGRLISFDGLPALVAEVIGAWTGVPVEQLGVNTTPG